MLQTSMNPMTQFFWPNSTRIDGPSALFSLGRLQAEALKAALRYQIEILRFGKNRCEQNLRLLENISSPGHVTDAFDLCCNFWQNAVLDYSEEVAHMAELGSSVAAKAAKRVRQGEKLVVEDLAAQTAM